MVALDKLRFWKKKKKDEDIFEESESESESLFNEPSSIPEVPESFNVNDSPSFDGSSMPADYTSTTPPIPHTSTSPFGDKDLQLISAKLDTVNSKLDIVIQRLDKLEKDKW